MNIQIYEAITITRRYLEKDTDFIIDYKLVDDMSKLKVGSILTYDKIVFFKITKIYSDSFSFDCKSTHISL